MGWSRSPAGWEYEVWGDPNGQHVLPMFASADQPAGGFILCSSWLFCLHTCSWYSSSVAWWTRQTEGSNVVVKCIHVGQASHVTNVYHISNNKFKNIWILHERRQVWLIYLAQEPLNTMVVSESSLTRLGWTRAFSLGEAEHFEFIVPDCGEQASLLARSMSGYIHRDLEPFEKNTERRAPIFAEVFPCYVW